MAVDGNEAITKWQVNQIHPVCIQFNGNLFRDAGFGFFHFILIADYYLLLTGRYDRWSFYISFIFKEFLPVVSAHLRERPKTDLLEDLLRENS